jgi:hypothetical protein
VTKYIGIVYQGNTEILYRLDEEPTIVALRVSSFRGKRVVLKQICATVAEAQAPIFDGVRIYGVRKNGQRIKLNWFFPFTQAVVDGKTRPTLF